MGTESRVGLEESSRIEALGDSYPGCQLAVPIVPALPRIDGLWSEVLLEERQVPKIAATVESVEIYFYVEVLTVNMYCTHPVA